MSGGKRRSGFQITSVLTSPTSQSAPAFSNQSGLSYSRCHQGSSSQPTSPCQKKKYISHDALGQQAASSRFRVVRLTEGGASLGGRGQPYQRGRWICSEFRERPQEAGLKRVMDSMRNAHSLGSLDMIGWGKERGGASSMNTSYPLALPLREPKEAGLVSGSGPPSPEPKLHVNHSQPIRGQGFGPAPSPAPPRPQNFPQPLRPHGVTPVQPACLSLSQPVLRMSQSLPSSPASRPRHSVLTSLQPPSVLNVDQTVFSQQDTSAAGIPAIDNKIEQAMDLVKGHLKLAVHEEVELLKDQIRELQERNQQLETENQFLRALTRDYYTTR